MNFRVRATRRYESDLLSTIVWIARVQGRPQEAQAWLEALEDAVDSLGRLPQRCPLAPESGARGREIRQLLFFSHRVLFTILPQEVVVLQVRHASREPARPEELDPDD